MLYNSAASGIPIAPPVETRLVIGPNASLDARQAWLFMGLSASVGLGIGIWMALLGFWPVLPFAGLELAALGAAVYVSVRRNAYREVLVFEARQLRVEFGVIGRGAGTVIRLSRPLTRVLLEPGAHRHDPTRLTLSCGGQRVRIGACLTDAERGRLAARLKQLLTPAWSATPAGAGTGPAHELPLGE
ncbi:DUF2244 domain-containing protein [Fontimonas sp. SYSU GA230001]|uniref:DUF2244 domain-containing protein n=1 Tax=Fontimonas sp. SYSU GA230001 TaxID=3142450 RepID=UPI0032B554FB